MKPITYAETAYDSTRPRELPPPLDDKKRGLIARVSLNEKLKMRPVPVECGEHLSIDGVGDLDALRAEPPVDETTEDFSIRIVWFSRWSPLLWAVLLRFTGMFVAVPSFVGLVLLLLAGYPDYRQGWEVILFGTELVIGGLGVYYLFGYLIGRRIIPDSNLIIFDRATGLVHLPPRWGKPRAIPFDEFAPYRTFTISQQSGMSYDRLLLAHRYSDTRILALGSSHLERDYLYQEWEYLQQFMDVSKPLPDVPRLELLRAFDPTTIAWDRRMGRPPDLWRSIAKEDWSEMRFKAAKAMLAFPWGVSREQALATGWKPSCYSEMTWVNGPEPKTEKNKAKHWRRCLHQPVRAREEKAQIA